MKTTSKKQTADVYWVYMLKTSEDKIYTGIAKNVKKRIEEHSHGKVGAKSLKGKGPFVLLFKKKIGNRSQASIVEWHIKQLTRKQKEEIVASKIYWKTFLSSFMQS